MELEGIGDDQTAIFNSRVWQGGTLLRFLVSFQQGSEKSFFNISLQDLAKKLEELYRLHSRRAWVVSFKLITEVARDQLLKPQPGFNEFINNPFVKEHIMPILKAGEYIHLLQEEQEADQPSQSSEPALHNKIGKIKEYFSRVAEACISNDQSRLASTVCNDVIKKPVNHANTKIFLEVMFDDDPAIPNQTIFHIKRRESETCYGLDIKGSYKEIKDVAIPGPPSQMLLTLKVNTMKDKSLPTKYTKNMEPAIAFAIGFYSQANSPSVYNFQSYFDTGQLDRLLQKASKNQGLFIPQTSTFIDFNQSITRGKQITVVIQLPEHFYLRVNIKLRDILSFWFSDSEKQAFLKIDCPPSYQYFFDFNQKHATQERISFLDPNSILQWDRLPNFPLVYTELIKQNINRLFLYRNSASQFQMLRQLLRKIAKQEVKSTSRFNTPFSQEVFTLLQRRMMDSQFVIMNQKQLYSLLFSKVQTESIANCELYQLILLLFSNNKVRLSQASKFILFILDWKSKARSELIALLIKVCYEPGPISLKSFADRLEGYRNKQLFELAFKSGSKSTVPIRRMKLTPSGFIYCAKSQEVSNRLLRNYCGLQDYFARLTIQDDGRTKIGGKKDFLTKSFFREMINGFNVLWRQFVPLGWSPSQLRNYSLWYVNQSRPKIQKKQILNFLGEFDQDGVEQFKRLTPDLKEGSVLVKFEGIKNPAKKAARIGQCFSSSKSFTLKQTTIYYEQDIRSKNGKVFSDGLGMISSDILKSIQTEEGMRGLCALQVRFQGAKGMLVLDETLPKNSIVLRKSMIKYLCKHREARYKLDILESNRYHKGYINRQIILLLSTLGVANQNFLKSQLQFIEVLDQATFKDCSIFKNVSVQIGDDIFAVRPIEELVREIVNLGIRLEEEPFLEGALRAIKRKGLEILRTKSNFVPEKSARLVGILDQFGILEEGEIFVPINQSLIGNGSESQGMHFVLDEKQVVITRNPCLHPGDVRKVRAVGEAEIQRRCRIYKTPKLEVWRELMGAKRKHVFQRFVNVIVFPQKGETPITAEISGSDLDGDMFFISWNPAFIPPVVELPMVYDALPTFDLKEKVEDKSMLNFFAEYLNFDILGKLDNTHLVVADQSPKLANEPKAIELAIIHASAVDFPKTGRLDQDRLKSIKFTKEFPDFMEKEPQVSYISKSILGLLYRQAKQKSFQIALSKGSSSPELFFFRKDMSQFVTHPPSTAQIQRFIKVQEHYNQTLQKVFFLFGIDDEFDFYTGNVSQKDSVAKLLSFVYEIREVFASIFFQDLKQDQAKFAEARTFKKRANFSQDCRRKAMIWYVGSVTAHYQEVVLRMPMPEVASYFCEGGERSFLGLCWFVLDPVMVDILSRVELGDMQPNQMPLVEEIDL